jgi:ribokinase
MEWMTFLRVDHVPAAGEIVHATEMWEAPGGAAAGAVVQLRKLAGKATLFTAVGDDKVGVAARREVAALGGRVEAAVRAHPTRRGVVHVDSTGERTITVVGERHAPHGADPLPWAGLSSCDVVYFTAGDVAALKLARRARVLIATTRVLKVLKDSEVELDALVGSASDPAERYREGDLQPPPRIVVQTKGSAGGMYAVGGERPHPFDAAPLPGPIVDTYGAGDSFAGGLAYGLGMGWGVDEAVELAARCGAAALTGRGSYDGQVSSP